jgi:hypothetical protein
LNSVQIPAKADSGRSSPLWAGNVELAKTLISKRMGFRICAGERTVRRKPPIAISALF